MYTGRGRGEGEMGWDGLFKNGVLFLCGLEIDWWMDKIREGGLEG